MYSVHPDPANVVPLSQFGSVDICQDSCISPIIPPPLAGIRVGGDAAIERGRPQEDRALSGWASRSCCRPTDAERTRSSRARREWLDAGKVLWASVLKAGSVRLRATAAPDTFSIEGNDAAIAAVFGPDSKLELQQGPGLNYTAKAQVVLAPSKGRLRPSRGRSRRPDRP